MTARAKTYARQSIQLIGKRDTDYGTHCARCLRVAAWRVYPRSGFVEFACGADLAGVAVGFADYSPAYRNG